MLHGFLFAYALLLRTKKPMHGTPHIGNFFRWHLSGSLLLFFSWHYGSLRPFSTGTYRAAYSSFSIGTTVACTLFSSTLSGSPRLFFNQHFLAAASSFLIDTCW